MSVDSGEQYKDATHWITVGGSSGRFGMVTGSYGSIEPANVIINSVDCTIQRLYYSPLGGTLEFEFRIEPRITNWKKTVLTIVNLMNGRTFSDTFDNSRGMDEVIVATGESVFDATDIGKTIPLKIEITGSGAGSGTTQPSKPDPDLE